MGSKRVGDDSVTKQQQQSHNQRGDKKGEIRRPQIRRLTLLFSTWKSSFQECSLGPQSSCVIISCWKDSDDIICMETRMPKMPSMSKGCVTMKGKTTASCGLAIPSAFKSKVNTSSSQLPKSAENTSLLTWKDYFRVLTWGLSHGIDLYCHRCHLTTELCPTLCKPMHWRLPGSSVHGIPQARILEWVAITFSRRSSQARDQTLHWQVDSLLLSSWGSSR